jgi:hypothetical protein
MHQFSGTREKIFEFVILALQNYLEIHPIRLTWGAPGTVLINVVPSSVLSSLFNGRILTATLTDDVGSSTILENSLTLYNP